jgi:hypothetical protein
MYLEVVGHDQQDNIGSKHYTRMTAAILWLPSFSTPKHSAKYEIGEVDTRYRLRQDILTSC